VREKDMFISKIDYAKDAVADAIENRRKSKLPKDKGLDYAMELLYEIKPITEHPDVQRLVGQVVELESKNIALKKCVEECLKTIQKVEAENKKLRKALEPFANFACDDWKTHKCFNCIAKQALEENKKAEVKP